MISLLFEDLESGGEGIALGPDPHMERLACSFILSVAFEVFNKSFKISDPSLPEISADFALRERLMVLLTSMAAVDELLVELLVELLAISLKSISPFMPPISIGDLLCAKRPRAINITRIRINRFIYSQRA